jgi:hypothetical protein
MRTGNRAAASAAVKRTLIVLSEPQLMPVMDARAQFSPDGA